MIGTPNTMVLRTVVGRLPRPIQDGMPTVRTETATVPQNRDPFPLPRAAQGPDYGVGESYYPVWHDTGLRDEVVLIVPANYGQNGGQVSYANNGVIGSIQDAGTTEFATNKIRSIRWDPEALPGFDPMLPAWNNLPPGSYYGGRIPSAKTSADYAGSAGKQSLAGPLQFSAPGTASLVSAGLNGS